MDTGGQALLTFQLFTTFAGCQKGFLVQVSLQEDCCRRFLCTALKIPLRMKSISKCQPE